MRRVLATAALVCSLAGSAACGDDDRPPASGKTTMIEITFADGAVTPNAERIDVAVGQPIELVVKADTAGEIHVHSSPQQTLAYSEGTTTLPLTIGKPGVIDVEAHDLKQVIVQLQVK